MFGRGENPINFVSAHDVAGFVDLAVMDQAMRGATVDAGGPENLTMSQVVETFQAVTGARGKVSHVPLPMLRVMSSLMKPLNPTMAGLARASVVMDTRDMTLDASETRARYPSVALTYLADVVRKDYADRSSAARRDGQGQA
jgi:uncharacterized protein YbjT (DUF2867 family)